jgi:hypothetical protein
MRVRREGSQERRESGEKEVRRERSRKEGS